jgi:hypothetical protein
VREAKLRCGLVKGKVFVPLQADPGLEAEVDWGQAHAEIDGVVERLHYLCVRSKASGKPFVRLYRCERQQALFDALMRAFLFFGGVFRILIFDNLKTAVFRILQGKHREEQKSFTGLRAYYSFEARYCNPAADQISGQVLDNHHRKEPLLGPDTAGRVSDPGYLPHRRTRVLLARQAGSNPSSPVW